MTLRGLCFGVNLSATAIQHPGPGGAFLQSWFGGRFPHFFGDEIRFFPFSLQAQATCKHHWWIEQTPSLTSALRTFCAYVTI